MSMRRLAVSLAALLAFLAVPGPPSTPPEQADPTAREEAGSEPVDHDSEAAPSLRTGQKLVVVAPHLDDAALSVGATIARATRAGIPVRVLTVFAGDPDAEGPASTWDRLCGFGTAAEAARGRRAEDARACKILGADPVWLPFAYGDYVTARDGDEIWAAVAPHLADSALTLVPGFPLSHADHAWVTRLIAEHAATDLALYVEQPYANLAVIPRGYFAPAGLAASAAIALRTPHGRTLQQPRTSKDVAALLGRPLEWHAARTSAGDRHAKLAAIGAYGSQVRWLGRRLLTRIRLYEWGWGGEGIGLVGPADDRPRRRGVLVWDAAELGRHGGGG